MALATGDLALTGQQQAAMRGVADWLDRPSADRQVFRLFGYAGTGKCLGLGTPILMRDGTVKKVEDIVVGDVVMGPDSLPRTVLGLGRGRSELYRVVPTKGDPWICNREHVLTLTGSLCRHYIGQTIDVSVRDVLEWTPAKRRIWKLQRCGVEFTPTADCLDPYLVGLWLGDGHAGFPRLTNQRQEIQDYCRQAAERLGLRCRITPARNTFNISFRRQERKGSNSFARTVKECIDVAGQKCIPHRYLTASRAQRLELLAGLVDTDGHLCHSGSVDYVTVSVSLFRDVLFLARSLGFAAYGKPCTKTIKSLGFSGRYFRLSISGDLSVIPTRVPSKTSGPRLQPKRVTVTGFSLEPLGEGDYYGFTVNGDGRFLLGDFTVTHNTTIARLVSQVAPRTVFCAFTGKAASVLQQKGCDARTIHSLIYQAVPKDKRRAEGLRSSLVRARETGASAAQVRGLEDQLRAEIARVRAPGFRLNPKSEVRGAGVVVLDEASMVGGRLADDLLSFGTPVLALGDPAQLPPVRDAGFFTTGTPDVMLTEIVRQAEGSPVLRLATAAREGRTLECGDYGGGTRVVRRGTTSMDELLSYDQVIVGRNVTRRAMNRMMREALGRTSKVPVVGDRIVCLRNNHDSGLLNGSQWIVEWAQEDVADVIMEIRPADGEGASLSVCADKGYFLDADYFAPHSESDAFDFGLAVTAHKAQGSEWDRVYVVDESYVFRGSSRQWAYTAITRARETVVVSR